MTTFKTFSNTVRDLNKATNITKDDYFVTYNSNDGKAKKQKVEELHIPYKIASFDNYDDFNDFLDANFHTLTYPNGKYRIDIGGVPTYVTFEVRSSAQKVYGMWVESPAEPKDGKLKLLGNNAAVHFCSRVYSDGNWADWKELAYSTKATSAQAGLMTSAQYDVVENVKNGMKIYKGLSDRNTALQKLDDISICSDESIFLIQCTYRYGANNSSSICLQHIDGKYCHQTLFDRKVIKTRIIEFYDISRNDIYIQSEWVATQSKTSVQNVENNNVVTFTEEDKEKLDALYKNYLSTKESEK